MIADALTFIDPHDREQWVLVGMAIKSEMGDAGWALWADWSAKSDRYNDRDARAVWRSIKAAGGIRIGTLYKLARDGGWSGEEPRIDPAHDAALRARRAREDEAAAKAQALAWEAAAARADAIVRGCTAGTHDYLARKGFPDERGLIHGAALIVPMRSIDNKRVQSVQQIWFDGAQFQKKFLPGGRAKGAVFALGSGAETWLCEGYATGLSIRAALASIYRRARVVVCFSAGNLAHVASRMDGARYVVADNDSSGTGAAAAIKTGLSFWQPPDTDTDANDFHARYGVRALACQLREVATR